MVCPEAITPLVFQFAQTVKAKLTSHIGMPLPFSKSVAVILIALLPIVTNLAAFATIQYYLIQYNLYQLIDAFHGGSLHSNPKADK